MSKETALWGVSNQGWIHCRCDACSASSAKCGFGLGLGHCEAASQSLSHGKVRGIRRTQHKRDGLKHLSLCLASCKTGIDQGYLEDLEISGDRFGGIKTSEHNICISKYSLDIT